MSRAGRLGRRCGCAMAIGSFPPTVRLWIVRLWLPRCCRRRSRAWTCTSWKTCCTRWCWMILNGSGAGRKKRGGATPSPRCRCGSSPAGAASCAENGGPTLWGFPVSRANAVAACWKCGLVGYAHGPDGRPSVDSGTQDGGMRSGHRQFRDGSGVARQGKGFCPGDGPLGGGKPRHIPWAVGTSGE